MNSTRAWFRDTLAKALTTGAIGLAVAAAGLAGCTTDTNASFGIVQNQIPETAKGCVVPAKRSDFRSTEGTLDVALDRPRGYELYPLIKNYLPVTNMSMTDVEVNQINVTAVEVDLIPDPGVTMKASASCPLSFTSPSAVAALMAPNDEVAAIVQVLLPCHAAQIRALFEAGTLPRSNAEQIYIRASVRARGKHGGSDIMTAPFVFPIRVCYGCLQQGYAEPDFQMYSVDSIPLCSTLMSNPYQGNLCNPAQDFGPVLCCATDASGTNVICPAPAGNIEMP